MAAPASLLYALHAFAIVDPAGPVFQAGNVPINFTQVTSAGAGLFALVMGSEIDPTQRHVSIVILDAGGATCAGNRGIDTDSVVNVRTFNAAGAAANASFEVAVFRVSQPS